MVAVGDRQWLSVAVTVLLLVLGGKGMLEVGFLALIAGVVLFALVLAGIVALVATAS